MGIRRNGVGFGGAVAYSRGKFKEFDKRRAALERRRGDFRGAGQAREAGNEPRAEKRNGREPGATHQDSSAAGCQPETSRRLGRR